MGKFVVLTKLTEDGRRTIKKNPERIAAVNQELIDMGVKVLEQYAVLGIYDFVSIIEAPDSDTVMRMSIELGSRGTVQLLTLAAVPVEEFVSKLR